ncbi:MAG: pyridoxamine 5'-phosphate oxidase family protein [Acidobacteriaceae bacterium]|nr:pyridoxamine 5'-phosphate oxidase family protein [Acidobacteriaceae bacterium]
MAENSDHSAEIEKLAELIKGIKFAMLTTVEEDGSLHSRPMTTQDIEFDGNLWFFTGAHAPKVWEADRHRQVNIAFADPDKNKYVSASGTATLVRDRAKIEQYWKPVYKTFFPKGLDDPELGLLKIQVEKAEYWDSPGTIVGRAFNFARAYVTKDPSKLGDHAKVNLS